MNTIYKSVIPEPQRGIFLLKKKKEIKKIENTIQLTIIETLNLFLMI